MPMITRPYRLRRLRARAGFSIIELLVVTVLLAIVGGTIIKMLNRQQQFHTGTSDLIEVRSQLRQAAAVMATDLRNTSSVGTATSDIFAMSATSITFKYNVGTSIVCTTPSGTSISLPPETIASSTYNNSNPPTLSSFSAKPDADDLVAVYDEGDPASSSDDTWRQYTVASGGAVATANLCGTAGPFTSPADASTQSYSLPLTSTVSSTIRRGAAVRVLRTAKYELYKSTASDTAWYLGYCSPSCSTGSLSAMAGPFIGPNGLSMTYYDSLGVVTSTPSSVARISVLLQAQTRHYLNIPGMKRGYHTDSVRTVVAIRNRS